jgi:acyl-CoA synthetase (AMP-forming)/AMP-acid ligase II
MADTDWIDNPPRPDGWNLADMWEHQAARFPDAVVQSHGGDSWTWAQFDRRADSLAATMLDAGLGRGDKAAHYLTNRPEYLESMFAMFKISVVPVNTNYRYGEEELVYIWDNSDAAAVVFQGSFTDKVAAVRHRLPRVRSWIWVDDGSGPCPDFAVPYETAASAGRGRPSPGWSRDGSDLYFLYTGGTTGMPKGAMWCQDDIVAVLDASSRHPLPSTVDWDALDARVPRPGPTTIPAAPLMHGTGAFNAMYNLALGGSIVTLTGRSFDPEELLDTIESHKVNGMTIVGDAFAKPVLRALDARPDRWDISSLRVIISSGVMWSAETKAGLLRHNPRLIMVDSLGSSEAIAMASSRTTADDAASTASFTLSPDTKVLTEDGREVVPGSGERGRVALRGRTSIGYYKDPVKTASTFVVYDGVRWSIPGDWAEVDADGTVRLLGRGSQCINTGGEKVYPEEVEEVLKLHPAIADAAVVGVPDDKFGQAVCALVEVDPRSDHASAPSESDLIAHVKTSLAAYKAPKRIFVVDTVGRAPNGKLDYKVLTASALERLGGGTPD